MHTASDTGPHGPERWNPGTRAVTRSTAADLLLRRALDGLTRAPLAADRGHIGVRTLLLGPDPIRVLLLGGGPAIGYGVHQREHALDGAISPLLAAATGRGVIVENRAAEQLHVDTIERTLGAAGGHTFHLVVVCLPFIGAARRRRTRAASHGLHRLFERLQDDGRGPGIVVPRPPRLLADGAVGEAAAHWSSWTDEVLASAAAGSARVEPVAPSEPIPFETWELADASARLYERAAADLLPSCLRALRLPATARA